MTVQDIFNTVINHGYFKSYFSIHKCSEYMCLALDFAQIDGVITPAEADIARLAIEEYLDISGCISLTLALQESQLPNGFERRLRIYRDWANRPALAPYRSRLEHTKHY